MKGKRVVRIDPSVALARFAEILGKYGLAASNLYISGSGAEEGLVPGKRFGEGSDIDLLLPEPKGLSPVQVSELEWKIRDKLGETGVDFTFAPPEMLRERRAYDRVAVKLGPGFLRRVGGGLNGEGE